MDTPRWLDQHKKCDNAWAFTEFLYTCMAPIFVGLLMICTVGYITFWSQCSVMMGTQEGGFKTGWPTFPSPKSNSNTRVLVPKQDFIVCQYWPDWLYSCSVFRLTFPGSRWRSTWEVGSSWCDQPRGQAFIACQTSIRLTCRTIHHSY